MVTPRWCLGTRLLVVATGGWLAFLLLHTLLAGRWWLWLAVEAMPPVALAAIPLLLLGLAPLARPVRYRLSAMLVLILLAGAALAGVLPRLAGPSSGAPGDLRIFVWSTDIWHMHDDPAEFYAYLRDQRADVYLLQEYLYWRDGPVRIDDTARLRAAFPDHQLAVEGELLTLSRHPVVATYERVLPETGTAWYWRGRKAQRTDIRLGDQVLSVYNVHLQVPFRIEHSPLGPDFYRFLRRQYESRQAELAALRADLSGNPNPVLVAGDFNTPWLASPVLPGLGLRRHDPSGSLLPARSWPVDGYRLPRLWRLDWLFTDDRVAVTGYRLEPTRGLSDHLAQQVQVSLTTREE